MTLQPSLLLAREGKVVNDITTKSSFLFVLSFVFVVCGRLFSLVVVEIMWSQEILCSPVFVAVRCSIEREDKVVNDITTKSSFLFVLSFGFVVCGRLFSLVVVEIMWY